MKKLSYLMIGVFAVSAAAYAVPAARGNYQVFDVKMSGVSLEEQKGKGKHIKNGEVTRTFHKVVAGSGTLCGYVIKEYNYETSFLEIEKGDYSQGTAAIDLTSHYWYVNETDLPGKPYKIVKKGTQDGALNIEIDDLDIETTLIGTISSSRRGSYPNAVTKLAISAKGTGDGTMSDESLGDDVSLYVKSVKVKYNDKLTVLLKEAFADEYASSSNIPLAIEAAEAALNEFINKKAKIDDADYNLNPTP